jgi:hypothetical protein
LIASRGDKAARARYLNECVWLMRCLSIQPDAPCFNHTNKPVSPSFPIRTGSGSAIVLSLHFYQQFIALLFHFLEFSLLLFQLSSEYRFCRFSEFNWQKGQVNFMSYRSLLLYLGMCCWGHIQSISPNLTADPQSCHVVQCAVDYTLHPSCVL